MIHSIQQDIQTELERLQLASTDNDIGQGGGLDVDFDWEGDSDQVCLTDSQEATVFNAFALYAALEHLDSIDWDGFWQLATPYVVER
jgi:hypothetical protein